MLQNGAIVIYHSAPAKIVSFSNGKIVLEVRPGDSKNVREKDIDFVLHSGPAQLPLAEVPVPDLRENLELLQGEELSFADFTDLIFGSYTAANAYAAWKLLKDGTYFRFEGESVTPRTLDEIAAAEEILRQKNEAKERHAALVERLKKGTVLPEDIPYLGEIEQVALGINSASRLLKELGIEAVPEKAHTLLLKWKVWDITRNPFPARAGVDMEDPAEPLPQDHIYPHEDVKDLTDLPAYAIDDISSHDPDDAISYRDGILYVHIADPASVVAFDSDADREARSRGENLYLPEKVSHMLPLEATDRFGLGLNDRSRALTFEIRFDENDMPELITFYPSLLAVERRTYENASDILDSPDWQPLQRQLTAFKEARKKNNAVFIRLPEVNIVIDPEGELHFNPCPVTPEREFVANCMLVTGAAVAKWADKNDIPMPFVRQEPPDTTPVPEEEATLCSMFALRRSCHPGTTDTLPGLHAGLGLEPYTRVTSPLRRYADLLAHMQLRRYLAGEELLTSDELTLALKESESAASVRRRLERLVNEYWTLIHFGRMDHEFSTEAILVYRQDDRAVFLLPEFAYEYKSRFRGGNLGDRYEANILSSDPARFMLRLKLKSLTSADEEAIEDESVAEEPES